MKKVTFLFTLLTVSLSFGQNQVANGDFESPGFTTANTGSGGVGCPDWSGFKNRIVVDDITSSFSGQVENGDGSLFQIVSGLTPGNTYDVSFDYRWVAAGGTALTVRVKDELNVTGTGKPNLNLIGGTESAGYALNSTVDQWFAGSFSVQLPAGVSTVRLLFFKANGNRPLNLDNVSFIEDTGLSTQDLSKFNFKSFPNPANDYINISADKNIDKIEIYSLLGQQLLNNNINSKNTQVNVSRLSKGVYLIKAFIDNTVGTYKFIKQ